MPPGSAGLRKIEAELGKWSDWQVHLTCLQRYVAIFPAGFFSRGWFQLWAWSFSCVVQAPATAASVAGLEPVLLQRGALPDDAVMGPCPLPILPPFKNTRIQPLPCAGAP